MTALVLMVLLMASMAGVGAILQPVPVNEKNVIFISAGASADYVTGTKSITQKGGADSVGGDGAGTGSYRRAASANPTITAYDDKKVQWETETKVDLFADSYVNAAKETTVKSDAGDKVIAPGTTGDYEFFLENTENISLDYNMSLESLFSLEGRKVPIQIRLSGDNRWIVGGDNEWVFSDKLQGVVEKGTLEANQSNDYKLQWRWPYEAENTGTLASYDGNDTAIGSTAAKENVNFQLTITVRTEMTSDTEPATEPQSQKPGTEPATESESQKPGTEPATESESQKPGTEPATESESQKPGTEPATESERREPGTVPATEFESQETDTELIIESGNRGSENTSEIEIESEQNTQSPRTGDDTNIAAYAVLLLGSFMILVLLISRRRRLLSGKGGYGDEEE